MYKQWLHLMCKWATVGLDGDEFNTWQELTTKLNKPCHYCEEGVICESCKNSGLKLTTTEKMILRGLSMSLDEHTVNSVN